MSRPCFWKWCRGSGWFMVLLEDTYVIYMSYICTGRKLDDIKAQRMILKDVDKQNIECNPFEVDLMYSSGTL